jgi:hypothetical protein
LTFFCRPLKKTARRQVENTGGLLSPINRLNNRNIKKSGLKNPTFDFARNRGILLAAEQIKQ